jgi:membrane-bound inhibitor of C-type lysozyme
MPRTAIQTALVMATVTLSGCAATPTNEMLSATYHCDDGSALSVVYDRTDGTAIVNDMIVLPQAVSGSGFRYETQSHSLRGKGDEVQWVADGASPLRCVAERR